MDDEPMWAADRVVAPTPGFAITIPETANEFSIKGNHLTLVKENQFDGRTKTDPHKHIHEFLRICDMIKYRDTKNEVVRLMLFPLSLTGEAKTWLDELNEGTIETQDELRTTFISRFFPSALFDRLLGEIRAFSKHENESLTDAWLRMKEMLQNCHGHNLSKGNIIKIFYHGLREITQEVLNAAAGGIFLYKTPNQAYQLMEDKVLLKLDWAKNQKTQPSLKKTVSFADEALIQNLETKFDTLVDKQSGRPSGSLPSNTQPNPKGHNSKTYQPPQARNEHVNVVFTRSGKPYNPPINPNDQQNDSKNHINFDSDEEDEEPTPQPKTQNPKLVKETPLPKPYKPKISNPSQEEIFVEFDEFMAMTVDKNFDSEFDTEDPPFEKITIITDYKIKTSLEEPPTNLELKLLPDNLEYVFLEEPSFLPVIISSQLSKEKKKKLVSVLKNTSKPLRGKQQTFLEVVKKEIVKLLDTGIIYLIADSPWVSPIHCVPKKGGITVVTNENDKLVPIRTVIGYFQIRIDHNDQEKTTFTCPFGTYAYRRMPFGLCNAPATFQRCMLAIFHDMIEESVEVFMDGFSVFRNSFDTCLINLDKMLQRCKDAHLVLNCEKYHFMVKEGLCSDTRCPVQDLKSIKQRLT
nr:DNA-directed DNA polymerase [Tanacetum cinerariifolium]